MKNSFLFVTAAGLLSASTFSGVKAQGFDIGARVGANISYYHENAANAPPTNPSPTTSLVGFVGGIQGDHWFNTSWAISMQILYVEKNETFSMESSGRGISGLPIFYSINHTYIEIPLEVKLRLLNDASFRPYLFSGITVGWLSSDKRGYVLYTSLPDATPITTTIDFGVIGGAGLDYVFPSGASSFIDAGYRVGLINLSKTVNGSTVNDLRFCAGLLFPL